MRLHLVWLCCSVLLMAPLAGCGDGGPVKPKRTASSDSKDEGSKSSDAKPADDASTDGDAAGSDDSSNPAPAGDDTPAATGDWGTLTGRFVYDGSPPEQKKVDVNKDVEFCSMHNPLDERLVVAEDGGLANVVLYVRDDEVKVHPDYEASADAEVELDNQFCRFAPHIAMLRTSQTLMLKNSDKVGHNTKGACFKNPEFNVLIPAGGTSEQKLEQPERLPVQVGCNIHPWMTGYVLIQAHPYMAVSAKDGTFTIENLPVGEHEFQLWQEASGYLGDLKTALGDANSRGRLTINIKPGQNDLGDIKVDPSAFKLD